MDGYYSRRRPAGAGPLAGDGHECAARYKYAAAVAVARRTVRQWRLTAARAVGV